MLFNHHKRHPNSLLEIIEIVWYDQLSLSVIQVEQVEQVERVASCWWLLNHLLSPNIAYVGANYKLI